MALFDQMFPIAFEPGILVAIAVPMGAFMIPIVAILTTHQRRMAELIHGKDGQYASQANLEIQALRQEVSELRQLVHQQTIAMDGLMSLNRPMTPPEISQRISS